MAGPSAGDLAAVGAFVCAGAMARGLSAPL